MECYLQQYILKKWKQQLFMQTESNPLQKYLPKTKKLAPLKRWESAQTPDYQDFGLSPHKKYITS